MAVQTRLQNFSITCKSFMRYSLKRLLSDITIQTGCVQEVLGRQPLAVTEHLWPGNCPVQQTVHGLQPEHL